MNPDLVSTLFQVIRLVGGFFDFLVFVGLVSVALMFVRKVDGTLGYVLAAAAGARFLATCCTNVAAGLQPQLGEPALYAQAALSGVGLFLELGLWGVVLFVLHQLSKRLSPGA